MELRAAEEEDAVDKHGILPGKVVPARELYADMLLDVNKCPEALAHYRVVLKRYPNRLNALLGAAISAEKSGDETLANNYKKMIRNQTKSGNRDFSI